MSIRTGKEDRVTLGVLSAELREQVREVVKMKGDTPSFGHGAFPLPENRVLALPRSFGESRFPYGQDGFNFWACSSGYMYSNEGLFSLFPARSEGQDPTIAFFAALPRPGGWSPFSLTEIPGPCEISGQVPERFTVFSRLCAYYFTEVQDLLFVLRVYPETLENIRFSLLVENRGAGPRPVLLSSYINPLMRHQIHETAEDRWFRKVSVLRNDLNDYEGFHISVNEDKDRYTSISNHALIHRFVSPDEGAEILRQEATPSRYRYTGSMHRNLAQAEALRAGTFGEPLEVCAFTEPSVAADLTEARLGPDSSLRIDYAFRITDEPRIQVPVSADPFVEADEAIADREHGEMRNALSLTFHAESSEDDAIRPETFNAFFEHLKTQVEFCALLKGYAQLSENSLIGIRDVFQSIEALLYWRPEAARSKILEALDYTLTDGRCLRQYSLPGRNGVTGRMDIRPFIDQGVWVISTVATYLRVTGDLDFLQQECGYHVLEGNTVHPTRVRDSVLAHLVHIMDYLLANRDENTGCIRALYGDWNDALDGLGTLPSGEDGYGNGVSVMVSLQVYQNLREMTEILHLAEGPVRRNYQHEAEALRDSLLKYAVQHDGHGNSRILHGWGHDRSYFAGSFDDPDGVSRDSLTSNAFWVLTGMLQDSPELRPVILSAFERLRGKYGLRTFAPHFPPEPIGMGRIGKLPPGTAENGATYVHATAFAIMALFEVNEPQKAWEELRLILPFTPIHSSLSHTPFVMPNSYGHNPRLNIDGQNMNDWQTGSSNVVLKIFIRHVIGFSATHKEIRIAPASEGPFTEWSANLRARGKDLEIRYHRQGRSAPRYFLNDEEVRTGGYDSGLVLPWDSLPEDTVCMIRVEM